MANLIDNDLFFDIPDGEIDIFLAALEGPKYWPLPLSVLDPADPAQAASMPLSNHRLMSLSSPDRIQALRDRIRPLGYPDQIPLCPLTIERPEKLEAILAERIPFSLPKLLPIKDEAEFLGSFPGDIRQGIFLPRCSSSAVVAFTRSKIGVKFVPDAAYVDILEPLSTGRTSVRLRLTTSWSELGWLRPALGGLLARHDTYLTHVHIDEDLNVGASFYAPNEDADEDLFFEEEFVTITPDEDGESYRRIDRDAMFDSLRAHFGAHL